MDRNLFSLRLKAISSFLGRVGKMAALGKNAADTLVLVCQDGIGWEEIYYLTGFIGTSSVLLVTPDENVLFVDARYERQARETVSCKVLSCAEVKRTSPINAASNYLSQKDPRKVAFNGKNMQYYVYRYIERILGDAVEMTDLSNLISNLRRRKSNFEIVCIKEAAKIASRAFSALLSETSEGMSEREFAAKLDYLMRLEGSDFTHPVPVMVSSGERTSLPHSVPTDRKFQKGDVVMVDFGARVSGYVCDITRMFSIGTPTEETRSLYSIVLWAQSEALALVGPGAPTSEVDAAARSVMRGAGLGQNFVHGVGHGIGLYVHESPSLSETSSAILTEGDVITLEPGFYRPGFGGMRVEDDYLVTSTGAERITGQLSNELYVV